jgi:hypothetical protein
MHRASTQEVARVLHAHSVHDPYLLVFGPESHDAPGRFVLRVVLAVPEDQVTDHHWAANSLEQVRAMIPPSLVRWPKVRTTQMPALVEQWGLRR